MIFFMWIVFSFVAGALGASRTTGFWGALFLSLILSPLIGFIIVLASRRKEEAAQQKVVSSGFNNQEPQTVKKSSYLDEIKELAELKDQGVLTQDEFQEKKIAILKKNE